MDALLKGCNNLKKIKGSKLEAKFKCCSEQDKKQQASRRIQSECQCNLLLSNDLMKSFKITLKKVSGVITW